MNEFTQAGISIALDPLVLPTDPYSAVVQLLEANSTPVQGNNYSGLFKSVPTPDNPDAQSRIGTAVYGNLQVFAGSYINTSDGTTITYDAFNIDTIIMTATQAHNVVLTPIQGRDGEVVEYVGKASFRINFKGGFFSSGNTRPNLGNFYRMINSNQPIRVYSSFLQELGISEIIILDKNIPQVEGGYNYQVFAFNAIVNTPVILAQQINVS